MTEALVVRPSLAQVRAVAAKDVDAWWTVLVVDPVAVRLVRWLAPVRAVTPNRLTAVAAVLGVVSAVCFGTGHLVAGAVAFEARFLVDCLDGKVARVRRSGTSFGAFFDISADIALTAACYAGLTFHLASEGELAMWAAVALPSLFLYQYWTWLYLETHGRTRPDQAAATGVRGALARRRLALRPRSVDVEAIALFVVPLVGSLSLLRAVLLGAAAYYLIGLSLNWIRTARLSLLEQP